MHPLKKLLFINLLFIAFCFSIIGIFNYITDPFMFFRLQDYHAFARNQYKTHLNIIKHVPHDTVIIGTSTSVNTSRNLVKEILHKDSLNLCLLSTSAKESHILIRESLKGNQVKQVICGFDLFNYNVTPTMSRIKNEDTHKTLFSYIKYLLDIENPLILYKYRHRPTPKDALGTYNSWDFSSKDNHLKNFFTFAFFKVHVPTHQENFRTNLQQFVEIIKAHPQVKFDIYFTPYHILYWYKVNKINELKNYMDFKKQSIQALLPLSNVRLYDFQSMDCIIRDANIYEDSIHFHPSVNAHILEMLKNGDGRITSYKSQEFEDTIKTHIEQFSKQYEAEIIKYKIHRAIDSIRKNIENKAQ